MKKNLILKAIEVLGITSLMCGSFMYLMSTILIFIKGSAVGIENSFPVMIGFLLGGLVTIISVSYAKFKLSL